MRPLPWYAGRPRKYTYRLNPHFRWRWNNKAWAVIRQNWHTAPSDQQYRYVLSVAEPHQANDPEAYNTVDFSYDVMDVYLWVFERGNWKPRMVGFQQCEPEPMEVPDGVLEADA